MTYKYITGNNLFDKQTYMYSEYGGIHFLQEYLHSRQKYLGNQRKAVSNGLEAVATSLELDSVKYDLLKIKDRLKNGEWNSEINDLMNVYTKSFEVRKRIYEKYDSNWKPVDGAGFEDYETYLLFARCLLFSYQSTKKLKYFSCLLKVDDTILSIQDKLTETLKKSFGEILMQELDFFYQLADEKGVSLEE